MENKQRIGDCFQIGEVWMTPRGTLWRVMEYAQMPPGYRRHVVLRLGSDGNGRKQKREWDAVEGWVINQRAPSNA